MESNSAGTHFRFRFFVRRLVHKSRRRKRRKRRRKKKTCCGWQTGGSDARYSAPLTTPRKVLASPPCGGTAPQALLRLPPLPRCTRRSEPPRCSVHPKLALKEGGGRFAGPNPGPGAGLTGLDRAPSPPLLFRPVRPPDAPGSRLSMPGAGAGGNDTLFPFFSDFKDAADRLGLSVLETVVLASIFGLALVANAGAIRLVLRRKGRPGAANCLVLNLFCADLLFISAIPAIAVVRWTESWTLGEAVCHLLFYLMSLSGSVTILSLAAVSLERVVSIVRLKPSKPWKGRLVAACLLSIWALAALATLPLSLFFSVQPLPARGQEVYICTLVWPSIAGEIAWDVSFVTVIFLIPGLVIVISYSKILQIAKASRRRLQAGLAYSERHHIRISQQDFKLFRTLFLLMISFFVMWSPIIITILLILVQKFKPDVNIASFVFFWIMAFTFSNSIVNPVLYNIVQFRHGWRQVFFCCQNLLGKKETTTDTSLKQQNGKHFTVSAITR